MKIRIIGAGFYGCHIATALIDDGHEVAIHEKSDDIFNGASGSIPARIHQGFHYPRSKETRDACQKHIPEFLERYGMYTKAVPVNLYAIASDRSMVDFAQYRATLEREVPFLEVQPETYGLRNVDGAVLTNERHIVTDQVKHSFRAILKKYLILNSNADVDDPKGDKFDFTIDCTFCANDWVNIDRYEPCVVGRLKGPTDVAVTVMDGPFGSLYPWAEDRGLSSLSSAKFSPLSKECTTYTEAVNVLKYWSETALKKRVAEMREDLAYYYPNVGFSNSVYRQDGFMTSIRAMPVSGADTRLVDVIRRSDRVIRVRAGKIDAVIHAERLVKKELEK